MIPATTRSPAGTWWANESMIALVRLHEVLPEELRKLSNSTIYRWTTLGVAGVRLRKFRCGQLWFTTREEFMRWQAAITAASERHEGGQP